MYVDLFSYIYMSHFMYIYMRNPWNATWISFIYESLQGLFSCMQISLCPWNATWISYTYIHRSLFIHIHRSLFIHMQVAFHIHEMRPGFLLSMKVSFGLNTAESGFLSRKKFKKRNCSIYTYLLRLFLGDDQKEKF